MMAWAVVWIAFGGCPEAMGDAVTPVEASVLVRFSRDAGIDPNGPQMYRLPPIHASGASMPDGSAQNRAQVLDQMPTVLPPMPPGMEGGVNRLSPNRSLTASARRSEIRTAKREPTPRFEAPQLPATIPPVGQAFQPDMHSSENQAGKPDLRNFSLPYTPTIVELTPQLLPAVQKGYRLAQRGAIYAAQTEFIQVLRRIAQAKDAELKTTQHAMALAAGLRALDEADDFMPRGAQLEADLNIPVITSSHRTPVLLGQESEVLPHMVVALYHQYAQQQLGKAVAGEQAGSMALHGMGKIYIRMAQQQGGEIQSVRKAIAVYQAALTARPENNLAANELGVLLARNGHYPQAATIFDQALRFAPNATGFHNLAVVQKKLGMHYQAAASDAESQRIAQWERAAGAVSQRKGIRWVSPQEMSRVANQPRNLRSRAGFSRAGASPTPEPRPRTARLSQGPRPGTARLAPVASPFRPFFR